MLTGHCFLMLRLLQVDRRSHITHGKKCAFILNNETRLIIIANMTDLRYFMNEFCAMNGRYKAEGCQAKTNLVTNLQALHFKLEATKVYNVTPFPQCS